MFPSSLFPRARSRALIHFRFPFGTPATQTTSRRTAWSQVTSGATERKKFLQNLSGRGSGGWVNRVYFGGSCVPRPDRVSIMIFISTPRSMKRLPIYISVLRPAKHEDEQWRGQTKLIRLLLLVSILLFTKFMLSSASGYNWQSIDWPQWSFNTKNFGRENYYFKRTIRFV